MPKEETLEGLTIVRFDRDVGKEEGLEILRQVAESLGDEFSVSGNFSGFYNIRNEDIDAHCDSGLGGVITYLSGDYVVSSEFSFSRSEKYDEGFSGMRFHTTVGYDVNELSDEEKEFMQMVKKEVGSYFSRNPERS